MRFQRIQYENDDEEVKIFKGSIIPSDDNVRPERETGKWDRTVRPESETGKCGRSCLHGFRLYLI